MEKTITGESQMERSLPGAKKPEASRIIN